MIILYFGNRHYNECILRTIYKVLNRGCVTVHEQWSIVKYTLYTRPSEADSYLASQNPLLLRRPKMNPTLHSLIISQPRSFCFDCHTQTRLLLAVESLSKITAETHTVETALSQLSFLVTDRWNSAIQLLNDFSDTHVWYLSQCHILSPNRLALLLSW